MDDLGKIWVVIGLMTIGILILAYGYVGITGKVVSEVIIDRSAKIGFMAPLTGDASSDGLSIKRGVDLALEDSGLENVKVIYEDSGCDGKQSASVVQKLIKIDNVIAIVGETCSGATLAAAPIAEAREVVMVSPSSTSPKITDAGDYIFRTVPSDALQGDFAGNMIFDRGYEKLAILYSNEDYGVGLEGVLRKTFNDLGGQVLSSEAFERGSTDVRTQLTKIKDRGPDSIYVISNSPDSAISVLRQINELEIDSVLFGSNGLKIPEVLDSGFAENLTITSISSGTEDFAEKYKILYGEDPGPFAAQAYDAFSAIAMALKKGALSGEQIKKELYNLQFQGASGKIEFDENGDLAGNYDYIIG